jgi:ubiquinone/menaquinone biosynthesis C-methylase UbiE
MKANDAKSERDPGYRAAIERFSGFAETYDAWRPSPPIEIVEKLIQLAKVDRPRLVVDIGCGTGISTRIWADRAERVIGVEPSDDMLDKARKTVTHPKVAFIKGFSHRIELNDDSTDIVTCAQSLHWMEPEGTFREAARILRPGGVFAAYDCDWPPSTSDWLADAAYINLIKKCRSLEDTTGVSRDLPRWSKDKHLHRMRDSGLFRFTCELLFHKRVQGNAERLIGIAMSQGLVVSLLKHGLTETEIGLDKFREEVHEYLYLGDDLRPWLFCYRMRVGIA